MKKVLFRIVFFTFVIGMFLDIDETQVLAARNNIPAGYDAIYTIEDLYGINDDLTGKYILMNDIDLSETAKGGEWDSGNGWTPIGYNSIDQFNGILDGNGYKIMNMTIYGDTPEFGSVSDNMLDVGGLFYGISEQGIVKQLGLENIDISFSGYGSSGGIAYYNNGIIENCYVNGKIFSESGSKGGFVANLRGKILNCYSNVEITGKHGSGYRQGIGGVAGCQEDESSRITNCYFGGSLPAEGEYSVGPIVGDYFNGALIWNENNYYISSSGGQDRLQKTSAKPVKLTPAQMKSKKCFKGLDFDKIWYIDKFSTYQYPQLRSCAQTRIDSFELILPPNKLEYFSNEKIDLSGSQFQLKYEDGRTVTDTLVEDMVDYTMQEGEQEVEVSYIGFDAESFNIDVREPEETLVIVSPKKILKLNQTYKFKVKHVGSSKVIFTSSNPKILKINRSTGKAVAKKKGSATITVRAGKCVKKIKVTVK